MSPLPKNLNVGEHLAAPLNTSVDDFMLSNENEMHLQNSELLQQSLLQNIGVGIVKHDTKGKIVLCNKPALELLGLSEAELYGKTSIDPSWNIIYENGEEFPINQYPANIAITTQEPVNNVVMGVYRPQTQDRVWLLVNAEPQFDTSGFFLHVLVTFTDITAYKKIQDELHVKNQLLDSISANSLDVFGMMDIKGNYHYVSKAATLISGFSEEELLRVNALDLAPKKTREYIKQLLESLPLVGKIENMLGKIICKDDTVKYISWSFQWDSKTKLIFVNGRDKTQKVKEEREAEAKRIADEQEKRHLIFESEEQKRNSIGYELHENVGQLIAAVKVYLDSYEKNGNEATLQDSKHLLSLCIDELRAITYLNSLPSFKEVGFANAIEILLQLQFKKQEIVHALEIAVDEASISEINSVNIYRLIQLWLSHIAAQRNGLLSVLIAIKASDEAIILEITDEVSVIHNYTDYLSPDLMPIKERLNIIGGIMSLQPSIDNKCFTITFSLIK